MHSIHYDGDTFSLVGKGQIGILDDEMAMAAIRQRMRQHVTDSTGWTEFTETWADPETYTMVDVTPLSKENKQYIEVPVSRETADHWCIRFTARKKT